MLVCLKIVQDAAWDGDRMAYRKHYDEEDDLTLEVKDYKTNKARRKNLLTYFCFSFEEQFLERGLPA